MKQTLIRLCYRKIIDATAKTAWEKYVFEDTYSEFLLQAQYFDQEKKYATFSELVRQVPAAEKLHFLVSSAVAGYLRQLNGTVPGVLNVLGKPFLPFSNFRFEILNTHVRDKSKHQVAINFYSDPLLWHNTINDQLLVSVPGRTENGETLTEMFFLQPYLSIYSLTEQPVS